MSAAVAELVSVLERETALLRELVDLLQGDHQRLIQHDVAGLEESNVTKEEHVLRLQTVEHSRRNLTEAIGRDLGLGPDELRVSRICRLLGPRGRELERVAGDLRAVVGSLAELVAVSRGFLEQSIQGVRGLLSLIQSMRTPTPDTYDASGRLSAPQNAEPLAVRREV